MAKYPNQLPRKVAEGLWEIQGGWSNKLGRRMTVVKLADGSLLVHNAFELSPDEMTWLRSLSPLGVSKIVAPNLFHCSDAGWMREQFANAELYVPQTKLKSFVDALDVNRHFPDTSDFRCIPMLGSRMQEAAFFHVPTSTLLLTDTAFNMPPVFGGIEKWFMDWNKVGGRFGPSRLTRLLFCLDEKKLLRSYQQLLELPFERVIVNHGSILEADGPHLLRNGLKAVFPSWSKFDP